MKTENKIAAMLDRIKALETAVDELRGRSSPRVAAAPEPFDVTGHFELIASRLLRSCHDREVQNITNREMVACSKGYRNMDDHSRKLFIAYLIENGWVASRARRTRKTTAVFIVPALKY